MNEIVAAINAMTWVEVVAVLSSGIYVVLAAKESVWCWIFGIVGAAMWAYAAYAFFGLYIDALLQIYYVGISIYGWQQWTKNSKLALSSNLQSDDLVIDDLDFEKDKTLKISQLSLNENLKTIGFGLLLSFIVGFLFNNFIEQLSNKTVYNLFKQAQDIGSIKPDINIELVVKIYFFRVDNLLFKTNNLFDLYPKEELFNHLVIYNIKGIVSDEYYNPYFE